MSMRMLAKLFCGQYEVITPVANEWAIFDVRDGAYRLKSNDGQEVVVCPGDEVSGQTFHLKDGIAYIGDGMVLHPDTHWMDARARPSRGKDTYYIERDGRKPVPARVGERIGVYGSTLIRNDDGLLIVGGKILPEIRKARELSLLIFEKEEGEGRLAYFNVLESGSRKYPKGIAGKFVLDGMGGKFMERGGDNQWYDTARFYGIDGNYTLAALRSVSEAQLATKIKREINDLKREAEMLGVAVTDLEEFDTLNDQQEKLSRAWQRVNFVIASGSEWIRSRTYSANLEKDGPAYFPEAESPSP